jgi:hypothetical protein
MADTSWAADSDEKGDLYAEALALGADIFILSAEKRAQKFVDIKKSTGNYYVVFLT